MNPVWLEYLTMEEQSAFTHLADALGGPSDWWKVEPLKKIAETLVWRRMVNAISEQQPVRTKEQAATEAADAVGVELETVRSRLRRWLERAFSATS